MHATIVTPPPIRDMTRLSRNALGSVYMTLGSLAYVLNDAAIRLATEEGLGVYQALCLRGAAMALVFGVVGRVRGEQTKRPHFERPLIVRVIAELVATALFFAGLVRMEFANAQAILQVAPLAVMLVAAFVLGEQVSKKRYVTILIGFLGVVVVIRPATSGFTVWSLVIVASVAAMVVRELATRDVRPDTPALSIAFITAVASSALMGVLAALSGWSPLTSKGLLFVSLAAGLLFFGYLFTIETVRIGDLSVSAPFRYTVLVGAVIAGYLVFGEALDVLSIVGMGLILVSGLYAVWLDRREPLPSSRY